VVELQAVACSVVWRRRRDVQRNPLDVVQAVISETVYKMSVPLGYDLGVAVSLSATAEACVLDA